MNLSEDEKITLGDFCERTLCDDAFSAITNLYETATVQQLLSTKPQDRGRRDELFFSIRGVRDFLSLMAQLVAEKNRLLDTTPEPSDDDKPVDIYEMPDDGEASDDV